MTKKNLLLDVDEVICFSGFLESVNEFMQTNYEIDDFTDYYIDEAAIPKNKMADFNKFVSEKNLYQNAHILPNAIETIRILNGLYNLYICSACLNPFDVASSGKIFKDKYDFLIKTLPFIEPSHFIFTSTKNIIKADIQIDDRVANLANDIKVRILFPSYHNKNISSKELVEKGIIRAGYNWQNGWKEVANILIENKLK